MTERQKLARGRGLDKEGIETREDGKDTTASESFDYTCREGWKRERNTFPLAHPPASLGMEKRRNCGISFRKRDFFREKIKMENLRPISFSSRQSFSSFLYLGSITISSETE